MAAARTRISRTCAFFLASLHLLFPCIHSGKEPLLIWTYLGKTCRVQRMFVDNTHFSQHLETVLSDGPRNVLFFLQDKMSMDDVVLRGPLYSETDEIFKNLMSVMSVSSLRSMVVARQPWNASNEALCQLKDHLGICPQILDLETLRQTKLTACSPSLLVLRLPYGDGAQSDILRANDKVIGEAMSIMMAKDVPFIGMYTGMKSCKEDDADSSKTEDREREKQQRKAEFQAESSKPEQLMEVDADSSKTEDREREKQQRKAEFQAESSKPEQLMEVDIEVFSTKPYERIYPALQFKKGEKPCIMLWARNLSVSVLRGGRLESQDLTHLTLGVRPKLDHSSCDRRKARLVLNYENVLGYRSFKLIFGMSQRYYALTARRWFTLDFVRLEYDGTKATFNGSRNIYAPAKYSYRCDSVTNYRWPLLVPRSSKDPANQWRVSFQQFQIQGFDVSGRDFSDACDCGGYFYPEFWMVLSVTVLLILVLTYWLHKIMMPFFVPRAE